VIEKLPEYKCSNRFSARLFQDCSQFDNRPFQRSKKFNNQVELDSEDAPELPDKDNLVWEKYGPFRF
jgi:hypothetical protein